MAPVEREWRSLTDHEGFGSWFRVKLDGPFVPGEVTRGRMTYPGFEHMPWESRTVTMDKPRLFSMTWHPYAVEEGKDYSAEPSTLIEFKLTPTAGGGTHLVIVESGFDALPVASAQACAAVNAWAWEARLQAAAGPVLIAG